MSKVENKQLFSIERLKMEAKKKGWAGGDKVKGWSKEEATGVSSTGREHRFALGEHTEGKTGRSFAESWESGVCGPAERSNLLAQLCGEKRD